MACKLITADCLEYLKGLPSNSIDAIVTDPPYGLGSKDPTVEQLIAYIQGDDIKLNNKDFMGKDWALPSVSVWKECLRVLKPGGHLLAFAGSRTQDLMGLGIRVAGFVPRDTLLWIYGQGFPKGTNISKQIDKFLGAEPVVVGDNPNHHPVSGVNYKGVYAGGNTGSAHITQPSSPEAQKWEGWSSALKPAYEPIIKARKPFKGPLYKNMMKHGTGGLNIDACRIPTGEKLTRKLGKSTESASGWKSTKRSPVAGKDGGRWPANIVLSHNPDCEETCSDECAFYVNWPGCTEGCPIATLDEQTGVLTSGDAPGGLRRSKEQHRNTYQGHKGKPIVPNPCYGDSGGGSRFFYQAKPSPKEKNAGIDGENTHPTVKSKDLMRWLIRMVTPPGGTVLDVYCGSGTTGVACVEEGFDFIGVDNDPIAIKLSEQRIDFACLTISIESIYELSTKDEIDDALDIVFDIFDNLIEEENFFKGDLVFQSIDVSRLKTEIILGLLSSSLIASKEFKHRNSFIERARDFLIGNLMEEMGDQTENYVEDLLKGLL